MIVEKISDGVPPGSARFRGYCITKEHFLPLKDKTLVRRSDGP